MRGRVRAWLGRIRILLFAKERRMLDGWHVRLISIATAGPIAVGSVMVLAVVIRGVLILGVMVGRIRFVSLRMVRVVLVICFRRCVGSSIVRLLRKHRRPLVWLMVCGLCGLVA